MLLLVLCLLAPVSTEEPPKTLRKHIQVCPTVGYFFERQEQPGVNPGPCYLCYCKGDAEAVCTLRDSHRCNRENYSYQTYEETTLRTHRRRKHRRRSRRSAGLVDLFFKNPKKDLLLKNMVQSSAEECKPKSSKSVGCPPRDWCEGCLVCDCDKDGQWQCHVMSFCDGNTPRPNKRKSKKPETKNKTSLDIYEAKETTTRKPSKKKNEKRSVKSKKVNKKSKSTPNALTTKATARPKTKATPYTTTKTTPKPMIAVKIKKSFKLKSKKNKTHDVVVIKKYISTLSPITSPELLKYTNDPSKLAQILYQQYESNSQKKNNVKREIKPENKSTNKKIFTREYTKKRQAKYDAVNSKNMGDKILSMKQKSKFKLTNNLKGRKPVNLKEHNDRNTKMKAKHENRQKKSINNVYPEQKEILESFENYIDGKLEKDIHLKGILEGRGPIKLITNRRRNKRNVPLPMKAIRNLTNIENQSVNTSTVNMDQVSEVPERLFTNNGEIPTSINNYVYTVDDTVTSNYERNDIINNNIGYDTTIRNVDNISISDRDFENENFTLTDTVNYTYTDDVSTTESFMQGNNDLQTPYLNFTIKEGIMQEDQTEIASNDTVEATTSFGYTLHSIIGQDKQLESNTSDNVETTTILANTVVGYTFNSVQGQDKQLELNTSDNVETTNIFANTVIDLPKTGKQQLKNTGNLKIPERIGHNTTSTANIKKVFTQDIETIITGLNKSKLMKRVKNNKCNGKVNNTFSVSPKTSLDNRTLKSIRTDLETMLQSFTYNNTKNKQKQRMMAIKYLKKLYSKLFSNKNNKTQLNNVAVMESICDTFGPCKVSTNSVELINSKINELISETKKALNIITRIKGLLESFGCEKNNTGFTNEEAEFKGYVKKLNAILTDNYDASLTEPQKEHIQFIKNNTRIFINSISKFAIILNDILKIIHTDKTKYDTVRKHKIVLNRVTRRKANGESLHKIKNLFVKFNLLQNTFMRNMYQALSDLEIQNNQNAIPVDYNKEDSRDTKYKLSVNKYMNKINYNLGKLKDLALKMGANRKRTKRNAMKDNDAIEYLLTLMEYLLRQNNPLDSPPVTDGIDLLINAIRRAPDIKPIRQKALHQKKIMPTFGYAKELSKSSSESEQDNISFIKNQSDILKDISFEKPLINETQILLATDTDNDIGEIKRKAADVTKTIFIAVTTPRYVDVEDLVFNGDEIQKVYMATIPSFETTEDPLFEKDNAQSGKPAQLMANNKFVADSDTVIEYEGNTIFNNTTDIEKLPKKPYTAKPEVGKNDIDLLDQESEKQVKVKFPTTKTVKIKHRKMKRPRKQSKMNHKSDVSSITKEEDEERTRKNVIAEKITLRKHMLTSNDFGAFQSEAEESVSADLSPFDGVNNEVFPSYFN